jgi:hypothetical protein
MGDRESPFSARHPLKGYLFQCKYALFESISKLGDGEFFDLSIETLDDVVFEKEGKPKELLQIKHKIKESPDLTNASVALWKTIRIWCHLIKSKTDLESKFILITAGIAPKGCAASYLKSENRDINKAINILTQTSHSSTNEDNKKAYEAFGSLNQKQRDQLFNNVIVIDAVPTITDLTLQIRKKLYFAANENLLDSLVSRLEGWWFSRIIKHLDLEDDIISSQEIRSKVDMLRDQFNEDNLPIDPDILDFDVQKEAFDDFTFVKQLELINISNKRVFFAVKNYYRAFEHRSRWVREGIIAPEELKRYEDQLIDEWEVCFERMKERIDEDIPEESKITFAKALYEWAETDVIIPIRPAITEPFVTRGSYQILSNDKRVGWHPEFEILLEKLIMKELVYE